MFILRQGSEFTVKIEYKIMKWPEVFDVSSRDPVQSSLEELLKEAGSQGWNLVALKNQYMIFKRPVLGS